MNQPTSQSTQSKPVQSQPKKPGSNTAIIIILIVVGALVVLGVGGYLAWKYYFKAKITATADTTTKSSKLSLKTLEATFNYPNGTITSTEHPIDGGELASRQISETQDKLTTIYNYYLNLATTKSLTVSSKTMAADSSNGSVTLQGQGYHADIDLYQI